MKTVDSEGRVFQSRIAGLLGLILVLAVSFSFGCAEKRLAWHLEEMNVDSAWETAEGAGVTIAFVDSGISAELYESNSDRMVAPYNVLEKKQRCHR